MQQWRCCGSAVALRTVVYMLINGTLAAVAYLAAARPVVFTFDNVDKKKINYLCLSYDLQAV